VGGHTGQGTRGRKRKKKETQMEKTSGPEDRGKLKKGGVFQSNVINNKKGGIWARARGMGNTPAQPPLKENMRLCRSSKKVR